jgi:hypothetical protein
VGTCFLKFLVGSVEAQLQLVNGCFELAGTGIVNKAAHAYECSTISKMKLTDPVEVEKAIRGLKTRKVVGPDGPNKVMRH